MNASKSFSVALLVLLISAVVLTACGDSPTPAPAATPAAPTTAATPVSTAAAPPTAAPVSTTAPATTVAATATATPNQPSPTAMATIAPTTAAATSTPTLGSLSVPVPAGTTQLNLSSALNTVFTAQFQKGAGNIPVKIQAYKSVTSPDETSKFYDTQLAALGFTSHPEFQQGSQTGNVTNLSAIFTKGNQELTLVLVGPLDDKSLAEFKSYETGSPSAEEDITRQLKAGDNIIISFVSAITPAVGAGSNLPVPTGTSPLKLSQNLTKTLVGQFSQDASVLAVNFKSYIIKLTPQDLNNFYDQKLKGLGFTSHPETARNQQQGNVTFQESMYTRPTGTTEAEAVMVVLAGPLDTTTINQLAAQESSSDPNLDTNVTKQLKPGDSFIMTYGYTVPLSTVQTSPTATGTATFPVPDGAQLLQFSPTADEVVFGSFGSDNNIPGMSVMKITTYVVPISPAKLKANYDQAVTNQGYVTHPESDSSDKTGNVSFLTANYTRGNQDAFVWLIGPLDSTSITQLTTAVGNAGGTTADIAAFKLLVPGVSIIRVFEGTTSVSVPAATTAVPTPPQPQPKATTAPATTVATSVTIPVYTGATALKFDATVEKDLVNTQAPDLANARLKGYASSDSATQIAAFYDKAFADQGYVLVPDSQSNRTSGNFTVTTATYARGTDTLVISLSGPYDKDNIEAVFGDSPDVSSQIKEGSVLILLFSPNF